MDEIWKPIPGFEGYYEASNLGRIRSVERIVRGRWGFSRRHSQILKQNNVHHGYRQVRFSIDGIKSQPLVYIAETFDVIVDVILGILDIFIGLFTGDWEQMWNGIKQTRGLQ